VRRIVLVWIVALLSVAWVSPLGAATTETPTVLIQQATTQVLGILNDPNLQGPAKRQEREARLRDIGDQVFDWAAMAQSALAFHWRSLTPQQRQEFIPLFMEVVEQAYMDRLAQAAQQEKAIRLTPSAVDMESCLQATRFDWCISRGGLFYGTGTGREDEWRQAAQAGTLQLPGDGTALLSLVHAVDMARAVVMAVERAAARSIYNVVDDQPVDYRTLYRYIAAPVNGAEPRPGGEGALRGAVVLPSLGCRNTQMKTEPGWEPLYATYRAGLA